MATRAATGIVQSGRRFIFSMADFDTADTYFFELDTKADQLTIRFGLEEESRASWKFSPTAIAKAQTFVHLSQGDTEPLPRLITKALPPFLLSRAVFAELKKTWTSAIVPEWSKDTSTTDIQITGTATAKLAIDGKNVATKLLRVAGDSIEMWVVDDAAWPLIVRREEDNNYWHLIGAGPKLGLKGVRDPFSKGGALKALKFKKVSKPKAKASSAKAARKASSNSRSAGATASPYAALIGNRGMAAARIKLLEKAAMDTSRAGTAALIAAVNDKDAPVYVRASRLLWDRPRDAEFTAALGEAITNLLERSKKAESMERIRLAGHAVHIVNHLRQADYATLAPLLRECATEWMKSKSLPMMNTSRARLVAFGDEVTLQQLNARADAGDDQIAAQWEIRRDVIAAILATMDPEEAKTRLEQLIAAMPENVRAHTFSQMLEAMAPKRNPKNVEVIVRWWFEAKDDATRSAVLAELRLINVTRWTDADAKLKKAALASLTRLHEQTNASELAAVLATAT